MAILNPRKTCGPYAMNIIVVEFQTMTANDDADAGTWLRVRVASKFGSLGSTHARRPLRHDRCALCPMLSPSRHSIPRPLVQFLWWLDP